PPLESTLALRLVAALVGQAPRALAATLTGDGRQQRLLRDLLGGPSAVETSLDTSGASTSVLERVRTWLFSPQAPESDRPGETLDYFPAPGEGMECVEICRRIRALGVPFDRVAVLLRDPDRYHPFLEEAMRRAGIPAHFSRGVVRPDPAG